MNHGTTMLQKLYLALYLFLVVFTPDLTKISMRYLMTIATAALLLIALIRKRRLDITYNQWQTLRCFVPFFTYLFIEESVHIFVDSMHADAFVTTFTGTLASFLAAIVIGVYIVNFLVDHRFTLRDLITSILLMVAMQLVCVLASIVSPDIRAFFNNLTINNGRADRLSQIMEYYSNNSVATRGYGLSNNLFDSFGYITALLITICLNIGFRFKNTYVIVMSFIAMIMPLINARTGLVLASISVAITIIYYSGNSVRNLLISITVILGVMIALPYALRLLPESMLIYLNNGVNEIVALRGGETTGTFGKILGKDLFWPEELLLGAGASPNLMTGIGADNGYVNLVWCFGVVGTLIYAACLTRMFHLFATTDCSARWNPLSLCIGTIYFVYLLKIYSIGNFGANAIVFGLLPVLLSFEDLNDGIKLTDNRAS